MWFRFPDGVDQISIEQQNFGIEAEDKESGSKFFRAPDHFAPTILSLPGFSRGQPPEGAPEDLKPEDPQRSMEITQLVKELEASREENQRLRQDLGQARRERDELQTHFDDIESELVELKNNSAKEVVVPKPGAASMAQPPISQEKPHASPPPTRPAQNKPPER